MEITTLRRLPGAFAIVCFIFSLPCCGASEDSDQGAQSSDSRTVTLVTILGMTTQSDASEVQEHLERVSGVERVKIDLESGTAEVFFNDPVGLSQSAEHLEALRNAVPSPFEWVGYSFKGKLNE